MRLSISNICWQADEDAVMYALMQESGFCGLEIAPTRIFSYKPYDRLVDAGIWADGLKEKYGLDVSSMQSIWYGRTEKLFGTARERQILLDYTKRAVDFAQAVRCANLVFGAPRNRVVPDGADEGDAVDFFKEIGRYALDHSTVIAMEANPPIYATNYINDTLSALELIRQVDSPGFMLNLDIGTMLSNQESIQQLVGNVRFIHHVHISEPGLGLIQHRQLHKSLKSVLEEEDYRGYISIEMGRAETLSQIKDAMKYILEVFGG